jgi:hypothetical protein
VTRAEGAGVTRAEGADVTTADIRMPDMPFPVKVRFIAGA